MSKKNKLVHVHAEPKLVKITVELQAIFKRGAADVIQVGRLLLQAKKELGHGKFLPWLDKEFSLSEKTAQRYMAAQKFMVTVVARLRKSDKLSDLQLHRSALYELVETQQSGTLDGCPVTQADIEAILNEAAKSWVGSERLREILKSRHPDEAARESTSKVGPEEVADEVDEVAGEPTTTEATDMTASTEAADEVTHDAGDGESDQLSETSPDTAPKPELPLSAKEEGNLAVFTANVLNLKRLATGAAKEYVATAAQAADLEKVAKFVRAVADLKEKQSAETSISADPSVEARKAHYAEAEAA